MPDPSPSTLNSLKLQLLTARKKEWWPATADSLPQAVYLTTVKHTALVGNEPTTMRSWVQRATSCATETTGKGKWPLRHATLPDNYKLGLQIMPETKHFRLKEILAVGCDCPWSFWSWFKVNRPIFDKDRLCAKNDFIISFQWPWPLIFRFRTPLPLCQLLLSSAMFPLKA